MLLRQYLRLGARPLGFNVDPDFGDALDGLVLTDLTETEPRILGKYMGKEGLASFLAFHQPKEEPALASQSMAARRGGSSRGSRGSPGTRRHPGPA